MGRRGGQINLVFRLMGLRREQGLLFGLRRELQATIFGFPDFCSVKIYFCSGKSISGSPEKPYEPGGTQKNEKRRSRKQTTRQNSKSWFRSLFWQVLQQNVLENQIPDRIPVALNLFFPRKMREI